MFLPKFQASWALCINLVNINIDELTIKIRSFLLVGFSFFVYTWCLARVIDRTEYIGGYSHYFDTIEKIELYQLTLFTLLPIFIGVVVGVFLRPKSIYMPSIMLVLSVALFAVVS